MNDPHSVTITLAAARNLRARRSTALPFSKSSSSSSTSVFVSVTLNGESRSSQDTRVVPFDSESGFTRWDEQLTFPVHNLHTDHLQVTVFERSAGLLGGNRDMGSLCVPLGDLYEPEVMRSGEEMACSSSSPQRWFPLRKAADTTGSIDKATNVKYRGEMLISLRFSQISLAMHKSRTLPVSLNTCRSPLMRQSIEEMSPTLPNKSSTLGRRIKSLWRGKKADDEEGIISCRQVNLCDSVPDVSQVLLAKQVEAGEDNAGDTGIYRGTVDSVNDRPASSRASLTTLDTHDTPIKWSTGAHRTDSIHARLRESLCINDKLIEESAVGVGGRPAMMYERNDLAVYRPLYGDKLDAALDTLTRDALLTVVKEQRAKLHMNERRVRDLEDYIDGLLSRIMESKPDILAHTPKRNMLNF